MRSLLLPASLMLFVCPGFGQIQVPGQTGIGHERFLLPAPELDPFPDLTNQATLVFSGISPGARGVEVSGPTGTFEVPSPNDAFQVTVQLEPNSLNSIFFTSIANDGTRGRTTTAQVVQDERPPLVFIDFPTDEAELSTTTTAVAGRVSDILSGASGLTVTVNGKEAEVDIGLGSNGTFLLKDVPLSTSRPTVITAVASDGLGNAFSDEITVSYVPTSGPAMVSESGNGQLGTVGTLLAAPLEVEVTKTDGTPFEGKTVTFSVIRSDGRLSPDGASAGFSELQVRTDAAGIARAWYTLGGTAGCGGDRVQVTSTDISGTVFFCASAAAARPSQINIGSGNSQRGEVEGPLALPLRVWVNDSCNGVAGVPVTFTVTQGGGKVDGASSTMVFTAETGHAEANLVLGDTPGNQVVRADFPGNPGRPAVFTTFAVERTAGEPTSFQVLVLDNASQPLQGAHAVLEVGGREAEGTSDADGIILLDNLPFAGPGHLHVDGSTVFRIGGDRGMSVPLGSFPSLEYQVLLTPEVENGLSAPVLLPRLDPTNAVLFDNVKDEVLKVEGIEGLEMTVKAGSMTLADGSVPSARNPVVLSLNQVHHDDIPMPMPNGVAPPFAWTLQPAGATFDPPIEIRYPNMTGLPAGSLSYFLSFDHDVEDFVIVGTGTVTADGSTVVSDPGSGLIEAGWGCNCPPYAVAGRCRDCEPKANGCGPAAWGSWGPAILNCTEIGGTRVCFTPACNAHDVCYGSQCASKGSSLRDDCDEQFLIDMENICDITFRDKPLALNSCRLRALAYNLAVSLGGSGAYAEAQAERCNCEAETAALPTSSLFHGAPYPDQDGDLIPDDWELANGLDPQEASDAFQDPDGDSLISFAEFLQSLDPFDPDTDGDGLLDGEEVAMLQPDPEPVLDSSWTLTVNGQTVQAGTTGTFVIPNIAAPDQFGPGGPGTIPDFLSDDVFRLRGVGMVGDQTYYAFSEFFQIAANQAYEIQNLTFTDIPPITPESLELSVLGGGVFTSLGETAQAETLATYSDGTTADVSPATAWTTYRTSNAGVATVDNNGLITATGTGLAYITANNEGATAVATVAVSPGDPLTTLEGFVFDDQDSGMPGVDVTLLLNGAEVQTDSEGFFSLAGVPTALGELSLIALFDNGVDFQAGRALSIAPAPGGISDAGILRLEPAVYWAVDEDGTWDEAAKWNTGSVPGPNDSVVIARGNGSYTITVANGNPSAASIFCDETLVLSGGSLTVADNLLTNGPLQLSGGELVGGLVQANGSFELSSGRVSGSHILPANSGQPVLATGNFATLDNVLLSADLLIPNSRRVFVENGMTLGGTVSITSTGSFTSLIFEGRQTLLGDGTVELSGTSTNGQVSSNGGSLSLGSNITVRGAGTVGSPTEPLINQGNIFADRANAILTVTGTDWRNDCIMDTSGSATLRLEGSWRNNADLVVNDGNLELGGTFDQPGLGNLRREGPGEVRLAGVLDNTGHTLALDGVEASWVLQGGTLLGGQVQLTSGATLFPGANSANLLSNVTINGDLRFVVPNGRTRWENVTLNGTAFLDAGNAEIGFVGDNTLNPGATLQIGSANSNRYLNHSVAGSLTIAPGATITGGRLNIGSNFWWGAGTTLINQGTLRSEIASRTLSVFAPFTNQGNLEAETGGILRLFNILGNLGDTSIQGAGSLLGVDGTGWTLDQLTQVDDGARLECEGSWSNAGGIQATGAAQVVLDGAWTNAAGITATDSTVDLGGTFSTARFNNVLATNSTVNISGALDNSMGTLVFDGASGSTLNLTGGSITGGVIDLTGGAELRPASNSANLLSNVTINGDLRFAVSNGRTRWENVTLNGTAFLDAGNAEIGFVGDNTLNPGATIQTGSTSSNRYLNHSVAGSLTIAPGATITGGRLNIGSNFWWGAGTALINQGTLRSEIASRTLSVFAPFTNQGNLEAKTGGILRLFNILGNLGDTSIQGAGSLLGVNGTGWTLDQLTQVNDGARLEFGGDWSNAGGIQATGAAQVALGGAWTNAAGITATDSTVDLGGTFSTARFNNVLAANSTVNISGALDNSMGTLVFDGASGSTLNLTGGSITGGVIDLTGGAELRPASNSANLLSNVTINGDLRFAVSNGRTRWENVTLNGTAFLDAGNAEIGFVGDNTLNPGATIQTGSTSSNRYLNHSVAGSLTIAPGATITGGRLNIGSNFWWSAGTALINQGTLRSEIASQTLTVFAPFTNQGNLEAGTGGILRLFNILGNLGDTSIQGAGSLLGVNGAGWTLDQLTQVNDGARLEFGGDWSNAGGIQATGAAQVALGGAWTNAAGITATDSTVDLGGTFSTARFNNVLAANSTVNISGALDNSMGTLVFDGASGSTLNLTGGSITGGVIDLTGGAELRPASNSANLLSNVTINGDLRFAVSNGRTRWENVTLNGTAFLDAGNAEIGFVGDNTLNPGATLQIGSANSNRYLNHSVAGSLTIAPGATITGGRLNIGSNFWWGAGTTLINQGTLRSEIASRTLSVFAPFTNQGNLEAETGGILRLFNILGNLGDTSIQGAGSLLGVDGTGWTLDQLTQVDDGARLECEGSWSNAGGIQATGAAQVVLDGAWTNAAGITATDSTVDLGGTFSTARFNNVLATNSTVNISGALDNSMGTLVFDGASGSTLNLTGGSITGGVIDLTGGAELRPASNSANLLSNVTINGDLRFAVSNGRTRWENVTLNGTAFLDAGNAEIGFVGDNTLNPGATIQTGSTSSNRYLNHSVAGSLTIAPGATITGGRLNIGSNFWWGAGTALINQGTLRSEIASRTLSVVAPFANEGSLEATNGGLLSMIQPFTSTGDLLVGASSSLTTSQTITQQAPGSTSQIDGTLACSLLDLQGGELRGAGNINGAVRNAARIAPGVSPGTLTIAAAYEQTSGGVLAVELNGTSPGTDFDRVLVGGTATIAGSLEISTGYSAMLGDTFDVLTSAGLTGTFDSVTGADLGGGLVIEATYPSDLVRLSVVSQP